MIIKRVPGYAVKKNHLDMTKMATSVHIPSHQSSFTIKGQYREIL